MYMMYTMYIMNTTLSATDARNRFFELIDLAVYQGKTFTIEKDGRPAVEIVPKIQKKSAGEIDRILTQFRKAFARSAKRKYWSVIETPAWKKKERKYLERLSKGIID